MLRLPRPPLAASFRLAAVLLLLVGLGRRVADGAEAAASEKLPPIRHVFVLLLENQNAANTFGSRPFAPYLARTLTAQGAFLPNYYGIGHASLDNYVALV